LPAKMPLPATLLGRLAVDKAWQGRGIGAALLAYALRVAVTGAESIASAVIEVDAKDDAARSFYAKFGFRSLKDDRLHMFLAMETARQANR
jgi:predicted N-acetyltransferase YhbS